MDNADMVYVYNRDIISHMKEWNHAIYSNTDGPRGYHSKSEKNYFTKQQNRQEDKAMVTRGEVHAWVGG